MRGTGFPSRQLVSQDDAAITERPHIPRSRFIGSWTRKMAFDAAYLVPFLVDEVLPGDHLSYNVTAYVRMATPLFPLFDNQRIDTFFFYVPNRIVWAGFVEMMGEQTNPSSSINATIPYVAYSSPTQGVGSLYDHMGLPVTGQILAPIAANALPFRMYNKIWNQWFRDENIINSVTENTAGGPDAQTDYTLLKRAKSHDYFTSALPWPQKFTAPTIPLLGTAPIVGIGKESTAAGTGVGIAAYETSTLATAAVAYTSPIDSAGATGADRFWINMQAVSGGQYRPAIYADLTQATGVAINQLRQAWMVQQLLERDARGGTRYTELIRSHFGVTNPDFRLQRPEYIGGGRSPMQITPIAQTAPTTGVPLGALGGAGTGMGQHRASYAATEHGYIIGLINIRTELSYQQGVARHWSKRTRYDLYWPALAGLGEQTILRREIYATGNSANDDVVFGYQERWHEYRTRYSEVTGIMRSTAAGTIDAWHLAQNFTAAPTLSQTFIEENPPMARVLAAGALAAGQQYLADIFIQRTAVRPIPTFGTPVGLGRF